MDVFHMQEITAKSSLKKLEKFLDSIGFTRVKNTKEHGDRYLCIFHKKIHRYTYRRNGVFLSEGLMLGFDSVSGIRAYCINQYNNRRKCYG